MRWRPGTCCSKQWLRNRITRYRTRNWRQRGRSLATMRTRRKKQSEHLTFLRTCLARNASSWKDDIARGRSSGEEQSRYTARWSIFFLTIWITGWLWRTRNSALTSGRKRWIQSRPCAPCLHPCVIIRRLIWSKLTRREHWATTSERKWRWHGRWKKRGRRARRCCWPRRTASRRGSTRTRDGRTKWRVRFARQSSFTWRRTTGVGWRRRRLWKALPWRGRATIGAPRRNTKSPWPFTGKREIGSA